MRVWIAVGVVCLVLGGARSASAQAEAQGDAESRPTPDDGATASVEMSLSIAPTGLLALASLQFSGGAGTPGLGGLGGVGFLQPTLDVGFTIDRNLLFVAGVAAQGSTHDGGTSSLGVSLPLSLLWYLETPRVGHVMPMLRVGVQLAYEHWEDVSYGVMESYALGALARGGITWLADRCIGIRAELGLRGAASVWTQSSVGGTIGLDALVGVVIRV
jgi:hypothetical protein